MGCYHYPVRGRQQQTTFALLRGDFFLTSRFGPSEAAQVLRILSHELSDASSDSLSNENSNQQE